MVHKKGAVSSQEVLKEETSWFHFSTRVVVLFIGFIAVLGR